MTTFIKGNERLTIERDAYSDSPRSWDNLGTMVFFGRNEHLGDKHEIPFEKANSIENRYISLPVYMYSHSGQTIATTPFSCPWDSGKLGFIYVTHEKAKEHFGWKYITKKRKEQLLEYLNGEVKTLDQYINVDVYGFTHSIPNEEDDSCRGFYGDDFEDIFDHIGEKKEDWEEI